MLDTFVWVSMFPCLYSWDKPQCLLRRFAKLRISRLTCRVLRFPPTLTKKSCIIFTSNWFLHGINAPLRSAYFPFLDLRYFCLLYTSDAADEEDSVDLGGRRIIKKKNK